MTDEPQPEPKKNRYRVIMIGGSFFDVMTSSEWPDFLNLIRANNAVMTDVGFTPLTSVITIQRLQDEPQGQNIVPLHGGTQTVN